MIGGVLMVVHVFRLCIPVLALLLLSRGEVLADTRVALLIGNSAYQTLTPMKSSIANVAAMKTAFAKAGFDDVETALELGHDDLIRRLRAFEVKADRADVGVIYYSGRGFEMDDWYALVPVDAKLQSDRDAADETVSLDRMLEAIGGARRLKLVILDSPRQGPAKPEPLLRCCRSHGGTGRFQAERGSLVLFATKYGGAFIEGDERIDPFTTALMARLFEPGRDIMVAAQAVRGDVLAATDRKQEPFAFGSLDVGNYLLAK